MLQQSAAGTLQRLQNTLAGNDDLRSRFASSLSAQPLVPLEPIDQQAVPSPPIAEAEAAL